MSEGDQVTNTILLAVLSNVQISAYTNTFLMVWKQLSQLSQVLSVISLCKCYFIKWGISQVRVGSQYKTLGCLLKLQVLLQKHIAKNTQQRCAMGGMVTKRENTIML